MVDHDHDRIGAVFRQWKIGHEIDTQRAKKSVRSTRNGIKRRSRRPSIDLELLTCCTAGNIISSKGSQAWPPIRKTDTPRRSQCTWMACYRCIMMIRDNLSSQVQIVWDIQSTIVKETAGVIGSFLYSPFRGLNLRIRKFRKRFPSGIVLLLSRNYG